MTTFDFQQITQPGKVAPQHYPQIPPRAPLVHLSLELLGDEEVLLPGNTYAIAVCISHQSEYEPVTSGSELDFYLACSNQEVVDIEDSVINQLDWHNDDEILCQFSVKIAVQCPIGNIKFQLTGKKRNSLRRPKTLASLDNIFLAGTYHPKEDTIKQNQCAIDLTERPPEYIAFLHIEEAEKIPQDTFNKYRLTYLHCHFCITAIIYAHNTLSLQNFLNRLKEKKVKHRHIKDEIGEFSRKLDNNLKQAFYRLYEQYPDTACLIIVDYPCSEVPWEMLSLKESANIHLGTHLNVARWLHTQDEQGTRLLTLQHTLQQGHLITYLNDEVVQQQEAEILNTLTHETYRTTDELTKRMRQSLQQIGLVYISCHGRFSYHSRYQVRFGADTDTNEQVISIELESLGYQAQRPLFFINACHSGRLSAENGVFYGLPEVLLARVANGYIGTLSEIDIKYAAHIAGRILNAAASEGGVQITQILRQLRQEAVTQLFDDETLNKNWYNFIDTFSYIYYGNPLMRLSIV